MTAIASDAPPWNIPAKWSQILRLLSDASLDARTAITEVRRVGRSISDRIDALFPGMDELCEATCPWCPEPCCLGARVWFDQRDLLVLWAAGRPAPPHQPISSWQDRCRYLGPKGCRLDRKVRPWICTWYLCPTQKSRLRSRSPESLHSLEAQLRDIGADRKRMEAQFLKIRAELLPPLPLG